MAVRKETIRKQFMDALPAFLEPGETVQTGAYGVSGPNPMLAQGLLGLIGLLIFNMRWYFMAVTDRRVVFVKASFWTGRPKGLGFADPKGAVSLSEVVTDAKLWNHLKYSGPSVQKPLRLNFHAWWRDECKQVVDALGATGPSSAMPPPAPGVPPAPPT
jgi:hypothetical protein